LTRGSSLLGMPEAVWGAEPLPLKIISARSGLSGDDRFTWDPGDGDDTFDGGDGTGTKLAGVGCPELTTIHSRSCHFG
jgi:hypothetical protein